VKALSFSLFSAVLAVGLVACGGPQNPGVEVARPFFQLPEDSGERSAWMAYGMKRRLWIDGTFHEKFPEEKSYRYTFDEELDARATVAEIWAELRDKDHVTSQYFAELDRVRTAGYMREYVWHCLPHDAWSAPLGLRSREFAQWLSANLPDHVAITPVAVRPAADGVHVIIGLPAHPPQRCAVTGDTPG
jgi:hypothetical protein